MTIPFFFFQAEDGIRDKLVTGVQTCALPISFRTSSGTFSTPPCASHHDFKSLPETYSSSRLETAADQNRCRAVARCWGVHQSFLSTTGTASPPALTKACGKVAFTFCSAISVRRIIYAYARIIRHRHPTGHEMSPSQVQSAPRLPSEKKSSPPNRTRRSHGLSIGGVRL